MSIESLDLILSDLYRMDIWYPSRFKQKLGFCLSSYSIWAINELERYIAGRLYPQKSGSIDEFIEIVTDFHNLMVRFSEVRPDENIMFSIARDMATEVLDTLRAMK